MLHSFVNSVEFHQNNELVLFNTRPEFLTGNNPVNCLTYQCNGIVLNLANDQVVSYPLNNFNVTPPLYDWPSDLTDPLPSIPNHEKLIIMFQHETTLYFTKSNAFLKAPPFDITQYNISNLDLNKYYILLLVDDEVFLFAIRHKFSLRLFWYGSLLEHL